MLSILIPTANYSAFPLAKELSAQAQELNWEIEILVSDNSQDEILQENLNLERLPLTKLYTPDHLKGRSANRNFLIQRSTYKNILFIDSDSKVLSKEYLSAYLTHLEGNASKIIYGGRVHSQVPPTKKSLLRWKYGRFVEDKNAQKRASKPYRSLLFNNTVMPKEVVLDTSLFEESLEKYGHEDTLLAYHMMKHQIPVLHIDNPIQHDHIESNAIFLRKSEEAIENLHYIVKHQLIGYDFTRLSRLHHTLKAWRVDRAFAHLYKNYRPKLSAHLVSENPSLYIFNLYKLSYFCHLDLKK